MPWRPQKLPAMRSQLKEHDLLVICPEERVYYKAITPWSIQWVGLYGKTVESYIKQLGINGTAPVFHVALYRELETVLDKLYTLGEDSSVSSALLQSALIYQFFSILFQCSDYKQSIDFISSAVNIISYNYNSGLTIEKLADILHINASYFTRIFKKEIGISPKRYILTKQITRAKELLASTDASVFEIANSVGFSDQLYFSRVFSKFEKISPSEYRKRHRIN